MADRQETATVRLLRPRQCWMAALSLVVLVVLPAPWAAEARPIQYYDLETGDIALPDPPDLGPGPFGNAYFRETRDIRVLADGGTGAKPIEAWDIAVLRTFILAGDKTHTHTYLALLNLETNRTFHIDMGMSQSDFIHSRLATGDFTGNGMPDVALGLNGGIDIVHLQDDPDQPIAYHRRIEHDQLDLGMSMDFIPYTSPTMPYVVWPLRLLALADMNGDGTDELWTTGRYYDQLDGEYVGIGAQILFMQDPGPDDALPSVMHTSPLSPDVFPKSNRTLAEFGSVVARIGDRNGDGVEDVIVSAGRDCQGVDFFVVLLQPNYANPILRSYPIRLGHSAQYWLRGCREAEGPPVKLGFGTSTTVNLHVSPIRSPRSYFMAIRRLGDINSSGNPEILVQYVARSPSGNLEKTFVLTATDSSYSELKLLGFMTPPEMLDKGFTLWASTTKARPETVPASHAGGNKLLQGTDDVAYVFRVYMAPAGGGEDKGVRMYKLPLPVSEVPVRVTDETELLIFQQPGYDLNQTLNTLLAGLGLVCTCISIAHLLGARHQTSGGLASLLVHMEIWLFVFNAAYAAAFFTYSVATNVYSRTHGLVRNYGLNEVDGDPQFYMLKKWARVNRHAVFWLQQLALFPAFWHLVLAYVFFCFLVRGRSPAVLERQVRGGIWVTVVVFILSMTAIQATVFYARGGSVGPGHVIMHLVLMLCCFAVITTLYVRTLAVYVRRYGFKRTGQQWRPEQEPQQQPEKRQKQRQHAALWRLVLLLTCFEVVWLLVIINDFRTMHSGGGRESGMGDAPSTFMVLVDSVILGSVLSICWRNRFWWRSLQRCSRDRHADHAREHTARPSLASVSMNTFEKLNRAKQRSSAGPNLSLHLYASTYNLGSAGRDVLALGSLDAWIPLGFDLYIIGLQECPLGLLEELKRTVHARLGGVAEFALYQNNVWSTNGEIALLVLARARDVRAGAFEILGGLFNRVNLGVSLGAWRLPNKAAVGLACRLYDRTLALVTAHFAADKHGRERPEARVRDAVRSLKQLSLGHESEEVDLQLAFHHVIVLGDLNFRVRLPPNAVVEKLAASLSAERRALRRLFPGEQLPSHRGTPKVGDGGGGLAGSLPAYLGNIDNGEGDVMTSWRLDRHRAAIHVLSPAGPFGTRSKVPSSSLSGASTTRAPTSTASDAEAGGRGDAKAEEALEAGGARTAAARVAAANVAAPKPGARGPVAQEVNGGQQEARQPRPPPPPVDDDGDEISISSRVSSKISDSSCESNGLGWGAPLTSTLPSAAAAVSEMCRSELLQRWDWVRESDELSKIMREGRALHGFVEGPLCFPPSFRWVRGARADYAHEGVGAFEGCYTLHKAWEGAKGLRPPSYTDRVLVHSLPDLTEDLAIEKYDVCETMVGSDHRPVSAALRLTTSAEMAATAAAHGALAAPRPDHEVKILLVKFHYLPRKSALVNKLRELGRQLTYSWAGRGVRSLLHAPDYLGELCSVLYAHYPLAMDTPTALLAERRAVEMEEGLMGRHLSGSARRSSSKASVAGPSLLHDEAQKSSWVHELPLGSSDRSNGIGRRIFGGIGGSGSGGRATTPVQPGWSKRDDVTAAGEGERVFTIKASVVGLPLYMLLRLQGKEPGQEVGQGVLCLRDILYDQVRREQEQKQQQGGAGLDDSYQDGEEGDQGGKGTVLTHVDICHGGKLVGSLSVQVRMSIRRLSQAPAAEGAPAEAAMGEGADG